MPLLTRKLSQLLCPLLQPWLFFTSIDMIQYFCLLFAYCLLVVFCAGVIEIVLDLFATDVVTKLFSFWTDLMCAHILGNCYNGATTSNSHQTSNQNNYFRQNNNNPGIFFLISLISKYIDEAISNQSLSTQYFNILSVCQIQKLTDIINIGSSHTFAIIPHNRVTYA